MFPNAPLNLPAGSRMEAQDAAAYVDPRLRTSESACSLFSVLLNVLSAARLVKDYKALKCAFCKSVLGFRCHVTAVG